MQECMFDGSNPRVHPENFGLWLEVDPDLGLIEPDDRLLFILPDQRVGIFIDHNTTSDDIYGPDHLIFVKGIHTGQNVMDVLNAVSREYAHLRGNEGDPKKWEPDAFWNAMGFAVIPDMLKRYSLEDGYYHA